MCTVHGNLGVVARCGRLWSAPSCPRRGPVLRRHRAAAPLLLPPKPRRRGCVRGGRPCWPPSRASLAAQLGAVFAIVRGVRRLGLGKPGRYFGGKLLLRLAHARIGHRLVHTGIGLNLSAAEPPHVRASRDRAKIEAHVAATERALADTPKMSDLEVARRIAFLLSNPLRKTERLVDVRRLRCFSCSALGHQSLRGSSPDVRECLLASELRADV